MVSRSWFYVVVLLAFVSVIYADGDSKKENEITSAAEAPASEEEKPSLLESRYKKPSSGRWRNNVNESNNNRKRSSGSRNNRARENNSDEKNDDGHQSGSRNQRGGGRRRDQRNNNERNFGSNNRDGENVRRGSRRELEALLRGSGQQRTRIVNLPTLNLGTQHSYSASTKVIRSRKDNYLRRNFVNTVISHQKLLRKIVHTDTKVLVKKPLTVDNIKLHQQTNYVKNIWPKLERVWVQRYRQVVEPAHAITVSRSQSAARRTIRHPLQISSSSRRRNLGTRYERTQELGIRYLGGNSGGNFQSGRGNSNNNNNNSNNNNNNGRAGGLRRNNVRRTNSPYQR